MAEDKVKDVKESEVENEIQFSLEELQVIHDIALRDWKKTMDLDVSDKDKLTPNEISQHTITGELVPKIDLYLRRTQRLSALTKNTFDTV